MDSADEPRAGLEILGCRVDRLSGVEIDAWVRSALAEPWDGRCRHVVTLNPEYVMAAHRDADFARALAAADLATADGVGVTVGARWVHGVELERVTGVDLVDRLAELSGELAAPMYLLGAAPGVAAAAADSLRGRHSAAAIVGAWGGGTPGPGDDPESLRRITRSGARVLAVAYGAPGQITWIARNLTALERAGVRLVIGVGGALDYHAGIVARPPALIRRLGLEWAMRLVREPRRWRRQLVLPVFAVLVAREAATRRFGWGRRQ